jgi:thiaminase/transcriptional activator TenA
VIGRAESVGVARLPASARLYDSGRDAWAASVGHPMVTEIAAGTLPHAKFRFYFEQNIAYLEDYARALAMIVAKAPDSDAIDVLGAALHQIVAVELPANRSFLTRLGGDPSAAGGTAGMEAVTYAYTRHLLATAALGDCATGLACILPCQWSYGEIGAAIAGTRPEDPVYAEWIGIFGDPDYGSLVERTRGVLDRLAVATGTAPERLQQAFDVSTGYEVQFWDMAYRTADTDRP